MKKFFPYLFTVLIIGILGYFFVNKFLNNRSYSFPEFNVAINKDQQEVRTEIKSGTTKIALGIPITEAKMKSLGNTTTFDGKDTAVNYEIKKEGAVQGLKETIILKNDNSPNEFKFNLQLENVSRFEKDKKGVWHFYNIANKEIFYIPKGLMEDAKGAISDLVDINITKNGESYILNLIANKDWVEHPFRSYPIKVDPSILVVGPKLSVNVTSIGRFRWKLAVEYEIKDEEGRVLGSDVVILDVLPGETSGDIAGFLREYFTRRLAVWSLAQGNYTLYEMSNDRLSASYFQKNDSADNVDDEYKKEREDRKKVIDNFDINDYSNISLTSAQAYDMQNPLYDVLDEDKIPTGRKKRGQPAFQVKNEKVGAGTEILRPNDFGDLSQFTGIWPDAAPAYTAVDDVIADDGSTYRYTSGNATTHIDSYGITNTALTTETINSIDVTSRGGIDTVGAGAHYENGVRLSSTNSFGSSHEVMYWTTLTDSGLSRPGGGSWVIGDLNSLQAAIQSYNVNYEYADTCCDKNTCSPCTNTTNTQTYITQVYITVNYSVGPTPTPAPRTQIRGGVQIRGGTDF